MKYLLLGALVAAMSILSSSAFAESPPHGDDSTAKKAPMDAPAPKAAVAPKGLTAAQWEAAMSRGRGLLVKAPDAVAANALAKEIYTKVEKDMDKLEAFQSAVVELLKDQRKLLAAAKDRKGGDAETKKELEQLEKAIEQREDDHRDEQIRLLKFAGYKVLPTPEKNGNAIFIEIGKNRVFQVDISTFSTFAAPVELDLNKVYQKKSLSLPIEHLLTVEERERVGLAPGDPMPTAIPVPILGVNRIRESHRVADTTAAIALPDQYPTLIAVELRNRFSAHSAGITAGATALARTLGRNNVDRIVFE